MDWSLLWIAIGLALVIEGLPWFLAPERSLQTMQALQQLAPSALRWLGLAAVIAGVVLLLIGRGLR